MAMIEVKCPMCKQDEMWSYVGKKEQQCWLWHVIDHRTGKILAYALGCRIDAVYHQLRKLL